MKKRVVAAIMALVLAVVPSGSIMAEENGETYEADCILDNVASMESGETVDNGNAEEIVALLEDGIVTEETVVSEDISEQEVTGDASGLADTRESEVATETFGVVVTDVQEVETKVHDTSAGTAEETMLEFEIIEVLEEAGLASNASSSAISLFSDAVYTDSYGAQLSEDSKVIYDAMVEAYVVNRTAGQPIVTLKNNTLLQFYVDELPTTENELKENEEFQKSLEQVYHIMQPAYDAFKFDHPEVAWMGSLKYVPKAYVSKQEDGRYLLRLREVELRPEERYEGASADEEIAAFDQAVDGVVGKLGEQFSDETSREHKVKVIHDYLCDWIVYTDLNSETDKSDHSAAGVFLKGGKVVCEGYAKAFKILCNEFDISCVLIPGYANGAHMWNYVQMEDGNWYMVDPTWDDKSTVVYTYFLIGNETVVSGTTTLGAQRSLYSNFSGSEYSQDFVFPVLNITAYPRTHQLVFTSDGNATCTQDGTKTPNCTYNCGTVFAPVTDEGSMLAHDFVFRSNNDATCTADGTKTQVCTYGCGTIGETVTDADTKLEHSFTKYVSDNNATVFSDGTKTAYCDAGCGTNDTIVEAGTKLTPTYTLNVSAITLKIGQSTQKVKVTGLAKGDFIKSWSSSNKNIVTVTQAGKITGKKKGTAYVTVKLASNTKIKIKVTVQKTAVKTTKITGLSKNLTITKGKTKKLAPVLYPITSVEKITYTTSDKKIAAVNKNGIITAKGAGKAKITVKAGTKKFVITVTVPKTKTAKVKNVPETISLSVKKKKTYQLKAKCVPANSDQKITYSSSKKSVAVISGKGKITAKKRGTTVITVKSGSVKVKCRVTVK